MVLLQAMDFVDEQHVTFFEVCEQPGQVARLVNRRAAGAFEIRAHRLGQNVGQRGFAEAGRAVQQDVVERFLAFLRGGHGDFEPFLDLGLAGEFGKERRTQRQLQRHVGFVQGGNRPFRHGVEHGKCAAQRQARFQRPAEGTALAIHFLANSWQKMLDSQWFDCGKLRRLYGKLQTILSASRCYWPRCLARPTPLPATPTSTCPT